jgi:hypothetical protein
MKTIIHRLVTLAMLLTAVALMSTASPVVEYGMELSRRARRRRNGGAIIGDRVQVVAACCSRKTHVGLTGIVASVMDAGTDLVRFGIDLDTDACKVAGYEGMPYTVLCPNGFTLIA